MYENIDIYKSLQGHLNKLPIGFPSTKSGVEIKLLKYLFTPEEAKIAVNLNNTPETIDRIYKRVKKLGISRETLERHLDTMNEKGSIYGTNLEEKKKYKNQILAVGVYEYQVKRISKEFMSLMTEYLEGAFSKELTKAGIFQSRVIPVEKSISIENLVCKYDDIKEIINTIDSKIVLTDCICRIGYDKLGKSCKQTKLRENCFVFQEPANYYLEHGYGREISKNEVFEILDQCERDGLILQPGNSRNFMFICTCCGCCCKAIKSALKTPYPAHLYKTNYYAYIDQIKCNKCKICLNRCQTNAILIEDGNISIDLKKCIGCGLCINTCASEALELQKTNKINVPYKTTIKLYLSILAKNTSKYNLLKTIIKQKLRMKF